MFEEESEAQPQLFTESSESSQRLKLDFSRFSERDVARSLGLPRSTVRLPFKGCEPSLRISAIE